jgi:hypothetical protein
MCTKVFIFLLLAFCPIAFGQETRPLPGMQEAMAEMVKGKYRSREASASPWQNEIIVTSAHIDAVIENEICTNNAFDTKFVKQFNVQSPKWRDPRAAEEVELLGKLNIISEDRTMSMTVDIRSLGFVLRNTVVGHEGKKLDYVWLGAGKVIKGMSGGPVVALSDGAIVGIIMGRPVSGLKKYEREEAKYQDLYLFVPYNTLKSVWESCPKLK